jgi:hypothetical protein
MFKTISPKRGEKEGANTPTKQLEMSEADLQAFTEAAAAAITPASRERSQRQYIHKVDIFRY